jgi:hypothetical protein
MTNLIHAGKRFRRFSSSWAIEIKPQSDGPSAQKPIEAGFPTRRKIRFKE